MKSLRYIGVLLVVLLSGFIFGSCEIGLGSAVDTEPPTIEIQSPSIDSVIRDAFAVRGTWSDDGDIESITAVLQRIDGIADPIEYVGDFAVTEEAEKNSGTWEIIVDPKGQGILDGAYQITVSIKDKGEHVTSQIRTYTIDNTAPLIVLQRPSSKSDSTSVDTYGQSFTLTGQAADDNNVSLIKVKIYSDAECASLIHTVDLKNVPPTIELDVAKFVEGEQNDYSKIYGSTTKDGEKQFYCAIEAYDSAQRYPIDGNQSATDTSGNYTTSYYLYEDIATQILSEYSVTNVYHMFCGTYTNADGSRAADVSNSIKEILAEKVVNAGSFSLNPANNPTFAVSGRDQLKKDGTDFSSVTNNISNDSDLIVEVSVGLDAIPLVADSLRVYLQKCDDNGVPVSSDKYYPVNSDKQKSGTSYKFVTHIKKDELVDVNGNSVNINYGDKFLVGVEGKDEKDTPIVASGKGYGVKLAASGAAPLMEVLSVINPTAATTDADYTEELQFSVARYKDNLATIKENSVIRLKGTVEVEEGEPAFRILIDDNPLSGATLIPDANTAGRFTFVKDIIPNTDFANPGTSGQHTIKVEAEQGLKTVTRFSITYDVNEPTIKITSVTPVANKYITEAGGKEQADGKDKKYLNGKICIDINLSDSGRSGIAVENNHSAKLEFVQGGVVKATEYITDTVGELISDFDTTVLNDNSEVILRVTAKDAAGNTQIKEEVYSVSQATDVPVIIPNAANDVTVWNSTYDPTVDTSTNKKNLFSANQTLSLKFIDDDGINTITYRLYNESNIEVDTEDYDYENHTHGNTNFLFEKSVPSIAGKYTVKVQATDIYNKPSGEKSFIICITAAAPTVQARITGETYVSKNEGANNTIPVIVNISSDQKPFKLYRTIKKADGTLISDAENKKLLDGNLDTNNPTYNDTINVKDLGLETGTYTVEYTAKDTNTREGISIPIEFYLDNDAPAGTLTSNPSKDDTLLSSFTFRGTAEDVATVNGTMASNVDRVELTISNENNTKSRTVKATGREVWSYTVVYNASTLASAEDGASGDKWSEVFANEGTKHVKLSVYDVAGNKNEYTLDDFIYDKANPTAKIEKYTPDGGSAITITSGNTTFSTSGKYSLDIAASDSNKVKRIEVFQGTKRIAVKIGNNTSVTVSNLPRKSTDAEITDLLHDGGLTGTGTTDVDSGTYEYTVIVYDELEHETVSDKVTVYIDLDAPEFTITAPTETGCQGTGAINSGSYKFYGTASDGTDASARGVGKIWYQILKSIVSAPTKPTTDLTVDSSWTNKGFTAANGTDSWNFYGTFKEKGATGDGFEEGTYKVYIYAVDNAGNCSDMQFRLFDVDMDKPKITTTWGDGTELSSSSTQYKTSAYTLKYKVVETNGLAENNPIITVKKDDVALTETNTADVYYVISAADTNGYMTITINTNGIDGDGLYEYTINATDVVGKPADEVVRNVRLDTKPPVVSVVSPDLSEYQNSQNVKINGSAEDDSGTAAVWYAYAVSQPSKPTADKTTDSSWTSKGWTKAKGTTNWKITGDVTNNVDSGNGDGILGVEGTSKDLYIVAVDKNGLDSAITYKTLKVDLSAPTSVTTTTDMFTNETFTLTGDVHDPNGIESVSISDGTYTYTPSLAQGSGSYANAKNDTSKATWEQSFTITETRNGTAPAGELSDGNYTFTITTTDIAGKTTVKTRSVTIDTTNPVIDTKSLTFADNPTAGVPHGKDKADLELTYTETNLDQIYYYINDGSDSTIDSPAKVTAGSLWNTIIPVKDENDNNIYKKTLSFNDGEGVVYLRVTDKASNETTDTSLSYAVDTKAPEAPTLVSVDGETLSGDKLVNGTKDVKFKVTVKDLNSATNVKDPAKVASVNLSAVGSATVDNPTTTAAGKGTQTNSTTGEWEITIPYSKFSGLSSGTVAIKIKAKDKSGNEAEYEVFSVALDNTKPKSEIKIPAASIINGILDISGTVTENNPKSVSLYYSTATTAPSASPTATNSGWTLVPGATKTVGTGGVTTSDISNFTFSSIDVNTLSGASSETNKQHVLHLLAFATDTAGNECEIGSTSIVKSVKTYTVDMDEDRPIIKFTNMTLASGMSESNRTGFENTELTGNITDDDGIPATVEYKFGSDGTYGTDGFTYNTTDGTFSLNLSDGEKDVYFKITDLEGTVFESKIDSDYHLDSPKFTDKLNNQYGYITQTSTDLNTVLSIIVDTMPPEVDSLKYSRTGETYETSIPSPEAFGGTKNKLYLQHYAFDTNEVKRSYFTIPVKADDGNPNVHTSWSNVTNNVTTTIFTTDSTPAANEQYYKLSDLSDNVTSQKIASVTSSNGKVTSITVGGKVYTKDSYVFSLTKGDQDVARENWYLWKTGTPITISDMSTSVRSCSLLVTDGIKQAKSVINLSIDSTKPVISYNGPSNSSTSSGSVTAYGSVDSKATVEYAVSTSGTIKPSSTTEIKNWNKINQDGTTSSKALTDSITTKSMYGYKPISNANISWFVYFDNDFNGTGTHEKLLKDYLVNYGITTEAALADQVNPFEDIVQLFIWIRAIDEVGNIEETCTEVMFDPQGDKPTVTYSYPGENDNGMVLGGEIRLSGSATDLLGSNNEKIGVENVWAQIISDNHTYGSWAGKTFGTYAVGTTEGAADYNKVTSFNLTKADLDYMKNAGYHIYNMKTYHTESTHTEYNGNIANGYTASDYAALLTLASSSWSAQLNGKKEFDVSSGTNGVAIRVYAQDLDGKFSVAKDKYVVFDAQNPVIGNRQRLYLIQSADNTISGTLSNSGALGIDFNATSSIEYTEDMFVRGTWWLIGSVEDNDTIHTLKINGDELVIEKNSVSSGDWGVKQSEDKKTVCFKYKLGTGSGVGNLNFNIYVKDAASPTPGETTKQIKISYDNMAPELVGADDASYNINPKIKQSDGFYTFGSKVSEPVQGNASQSGLDYVAFYFLRHYRNSSSEIDKIYNPMLSSNNATLISASTILMSAATSSTANGTVVYDSGLYWTKQTVTRSENLNVLEVTTNDNIRVNGLVKIGGAIYKITAKTGGSVTLNGNPPQSETLAFFANAMVVDNTVQENGSTSKLANGYPATVSNDDGDGMVEYVKKSGATWTWSCDVVSRNIPDGPIELHYVVFDAAGNYSIGIAGNKENAEYLNASTFAMTPDRNEYRSLRNNTNRASNVLYVDGAAKKSYYNDSNAVTITNTNLWDALFIRNNGPRLAGVKIWTDYNGNGTTDDGETKVKYYSERQIIINGNIENRAGAVTETLLISGNDKDYTNNGTAFMTIRDKTTFTPEIIGGNGALEYKARIGKKNAIASKVFSNLSNGFISTTTNTQPEKADYMDPTESYVDDTKARYGTITFGGVENSDGVLADFAANCMSNGSGVNSTDDTDPYWFEYQIYDTTEGTTPGTDSLYATMQIALNVQYFDTTAPQAWIRPFYWKQKGKPSVGNDYYNSVVWDSTGKALGHIELESDLNSDIKTLFGDTTTLIKPKVSGQVQIEGYAFDNISLKNLYVGFYKHSGFSTTDLGYKLGTTYSNGSWSTESGTGWSMTAEDLYSNEKGHYAHWILTIDTAKVIGVAGKDFYVKVFAEDKRGKNTADTTTVSGASITGNKSDNTSTTQTTASAAVKWSTVKNTANAKKLYYTDAAFINNATDSTADTADVYKNDLTPYYKMDVVPYITKISTPSRANSGLKDNNIRSASGKYSVISGSTNNFIEVEGFNFATDDTSLKAWITKEAVDSSSNKLGKPTTSTLSATNATALTINTYSSTSLVKLSNSITKSGYIELESNGIRTLNNLNNNNAHGSFAFTGSQSGTPTATISDYENMPNREADYTTTKNVRLTDDRYLKMFNMKSTGMKNGYYPTMIMKGNNPVFGYINKSGGTSGTPTANGADTYAGTYSPSHAMPQRSEWNGSDATKVYTEYLIKASTWDQMGMAVDEGGRYYNVSVYNRDGSAMSLVYDRYAELNVDINTFVTGGAGTWNNPYTYMDQNGGVGWGAGTGYSGYSKAGYGAWSYDSNNNAITLDSVNYNVLQTERYQYPKLIAKGNSKTGTAYVYMAYYDDALKEICFRNFQLGTTVNGTARNLDSTHKDQNGTTYAQKINFAENANYGSGVDASRLSVTTDGSQYYTMAVTSDNHVIILWYSNADSKLKMVYSTNAVTGANPTNDVAWTTSGVTFPQYVGNYVSMALDSNNGIHISAFDANDSDLYYMYLPSYDSTNLKKMCVDQQGSVGNWTQIKVDLRQNHKVNGQNVPNPFYNVPVIAYYNSTETGSRESIKLAYSNKTAGNAQEGVDSNKYTTGNWEYMTVPAITPPQGGDPKFQNVCLDFDNSGLPVVGYLGTNLEFGKWLDE